MASILLVEDDDLVRQSVALQLETAGHVVTMARHGGEGLAALQNPGIELVVTDILMPEVEGVAFIMSIRKAGHTMPIIAISGGTLRTGRTSEGLSTDYLAIAAKLGATRTLPKPFGPSQLLALVDDCLNLPG